MNLSARLTLAMVAVVVLTSVTAAGLSYRGLEQRLLLDGLQRMETDTARLASAIEDLTRAESVVLSAMAQAQELHDLLETPSDTYARTLASQLMTAELRNRAPYASLRLVTVQGQELLRVEREGRGAIRTVPERELTVIDRNLLFDALTDGTIQDLPPPNGSVALGPAAAGRLVVAASGAGDATAGFVLAEIDVATLLAGRGTDDGQIYILSQRGEVLYPAGAAAAGPRHAALAKVMAALDEGGHAAVTARDSGEVLGAATAQVAGGQRIVVVEARPLAALFGGANLVLQTTLAAGAIATAVALALSVLLARSISEPLARMTAAVTGSATRGPVKLPIEAPGEVGVLARAFQMALDQERLLSAAAQNVGEAVVTINDHGNIERANGAAANMYGYDETALIGLPLNALSGEPEGRQPGEMIAAYALRPSPRPGEQGAQESIGRRKDGTTFPIEMIVTHTVVNGRLLFVAAMRDISQRKQAELDRQDSERRFATMFQTSPAIVSITNVDDGRLFEVNRSWLAAFELRREDVIGRTPDEVGLHVNADDRRLLQDALSDSGAARDLELRAKTPTGRDVTLLLSAEIVQIDGRPRVISTSIDVTDYRKKENQLRQVQRMDAVGQLAGGIAHDFNNLLTVILGTVESMRDAAGGNAQLRDMTNVVMEAADRGADLTRRLLAFSRRQTLDPEVIDANDAIHDAESILRRVMGEDVAIRLALTPNLRRVLVDRGQLESALLNLAVNARDAMPGGGTLSIQSDEMVVDEGNTARHPDLAHGPFACITVTDTGSGMTPEVVARAMEPFFTTKEPGKGTGLGLSMVYGFVRQSGGAVAIRSELGRGTSVTMYLPLARDKARRAAVPVAPEPAVTTLHQVPNAEPASLQVLVVEDEPNVRELVMAQLTALGYPATAFPDAPSALAGLGNTKFDLLVTDIVLPGGMNGRELADRLAGLLPDLRVLFTSGYSRQAIEVQGMLMAGAHLLHKPFRKAELGRKMRELMAGEPYGRVAGGELPRPRLVASARRAAGE